MKKINCFLTACVVMMLVLSGCSNGIDDTFEQDLFIQDGFGAVRVSFSQGAARTALPEVMLESFYRIEYLFVRGGVPTAIVPQGNIFQLEPGSYQLTVRAFMGSNENTLAAQGSSNTFTVTAGQSTSVTVTLQPIVSEGTGTFEFSMSYPAGVSVETYTLSLIVGGVTNNLMSNSTTSGSGPVTRSGKLDNVAAGYYLLQMRLKNAEGASAGKVEVVHIYQNMVTEAKGYTFAAVDFAFSDFVVSNASEWDNAVNLINAGGNGKEYTITIVNDFSLPGRTTNNFSPTNLTVTIKGDKTISLSNRGSLFRIGSGQNIVAQNVQFKGKDDNGSSLVYVDGGSFTMKGNASVHGNVSSRSSNLGINSGGGVYVSVGGTFIMQDNSTVHGNSAWVRGHGVSVSGTFTMQDNASVHDNGLISGEGGGVSVSGTFTMLGNSLVHGNTANYGGGVDVSFGTFIMQDSASVCGNDAVNGGGVSVFGFSGASGTFIMQDSASVYDNKSYQSAGGVYAWGDVNRPLVTMKGNASVHSNYANGNGGGLFVRYSTVIMQDSASVHSNTANNGCGGGVYIIEDGIFYISGGTIYGNNDSDKSNIASIGSSLYNYISKVQYGVFNGSTFTKNGDLDTTNNTIRVVNGVLQSTGTPVITINTQPTATTNVTAGSISGNLSVSASVTQSATLSYQWYSNTTASNSGGTAISGQTGASFTIPTTLSAGNYFYFVEVRATGGAASVRSNPSTVTVAEAGFVFGSTLAEKLAWLQLNAQSNGNYLLELNADENLASHDLTYSNRSNITITIRGVGARRTIREALNAYGNNGGIFRIQSGVTLILDNNITLQGNNPNHNETQGGVGLVHVGPRGTLVMETGTYITGGTSINDGGGVAVKGGTFIMNGGEISNNKSLYDDGGGVSVGSDGHFIMNNGLITRNTAERNIGASFGGAGGGVSVRNYGRFTMHNGQITSNTARDGGGLYVDDNGTIRIVTGTIRNNTATNSGAQLFRPIGWQSGTVQYGVFNGSTWNSNGSLDTIGTAIIVTNGVL